MQDLKIKLPNRDQIQLSRRAISLWNGDQNIRLQTLGPIVNPPQAQKGLAD
jgi:hypothetical protein